MFKHPISTANRKFIGRAHCGYKNRKSYVCCADKNTATALPPTPSSSSNELPKPGVCGFTFQDKIFVGAVTKITDFPWMALLQYTKPNGSKDFHCGGK